jgi:pimeloyl-ACP methyl ester carboxylesterase
MGALGADHDLIAVDPPGTGASDVPDPQRAGPSAYSPTWLAAHTLGALEAWERRTGVARDYVLVGHSLGAGVVLRALADPDLALRHKDLLARVRGAVLLAPADIAMEHRDPKLLEIALLSDLKAGVGERLGAMQKAVREGVRDNAVKPERDALRSEALRIEALLGRPSTRHAAQAMLRRFQPTRDGFAADLPAARRLADQERGIDKPVLLLWGTEDTTLPIAGAAALRERLPREEFVALEHKGHSLHQEAVTEVVEHMRVFLSSLPAGTTTP